MQDQREDEGLGMGEWGVGSGLRSASRCRMKGGVWLCFPGSGLAEWVWR